MELVSMYRSIEALRDRLQTESDVLGMKVEDVQDLEYLAMKGEEE